MPLRILSTCSARPNFVKLAALHHALLQKRSAFEHVIVHTGQHYDPLLSDIFFTQLQIPQPDFNLGVRGGSHRKEVILLTEQAMLPVLASVKPDLVLVYGDVNGAVGAARAAKTLGISIGHVEAGLRSGDMEMPEEHNRIEIDRLANLLFVSEQSGMDHLQQEGCTGRAHLVGNTMIDTLIRMLPLIRTQAVPVGLPERCGLLTLHRPSNVDDPKMLAELLLFFRQIDPSVPLVLPVHPRLAHVLSKGATGSVPANIHLVSPLGYLEFLSLLSRSLFVLTDSGGIQEEAVLLGKRCFTLRRNTERPSTIDSGSNILIDPSKAEDRQMVIDFAKHPQEVHVTVPPLWDGHAGERILAEIARFSSAS